MKRETYFVILFMRCGIKSFLEKKSKNQEFEIVLSEKTIVFTHSIIIHGIKDVNSRKLLLS